MTKCSNCLHEEKEHDYQGASARGKCTGIIIDHVRVPCKANCKEFQ